jgi:DNA-binding HxlR family transcriptional regulator
MVKEADDRDRKIDEILEKHRTLDDICVDIFFTLMAYRKLRFNELHRYLKKFGTDISKPALIDHLKHLTKLKLIKRKQEDFQNVSYGLTEEVDSLLNIPEEEVRKWIDGLIEGGRQETRELREKFGLLEKFDAREHFSRFSDEQMDKETDRALRDVLTNNLFELKTFVNYELKLEKDESYAVFWNFVGNPLYRMIEKTIAENCRNSEKYRDSLFEKNRPSCE